MQAITPFVDGYRDSYGGSVSGGTDAAQYFMSGDYYREQGVYANNVDRRANGHATVTAHPTSTINVSLNATYLQGRLSLPQNDNSFFGVLGLGLLGSAYNDSQHGYFEGITPDIISQFQTLAEHGAVFDGRDRYMARAAVAHRNGAGRGRFPEPPRQQRPAVQSAREQRSGDGARGGHCRPSASLDVLDERDGDGELRAVEADPGQDYGRRAVHRPIHEAFPSSGVGLVGTTTSLAGLSSQFTASEANTDQPTVAVYGQQEFSLNDRIFLTGTLRHEATGILDEPTPSTTYPSGSLSWVMGEEPWFPKTSILSSFRCGRH